MPYLRKKSKAFGLKTGAVEVSKGGGRGILLEGVVGKKNIRNSGPQPTQSCKHGRGKVRTASLQICAQPIGQIALWKKMLNPHISIVIQLEETNAKALLIGDSTAFLFFMDSRNHI